MSDLISREAVIEVIENDIRSGAHSSFYSFDDAEDFEKRIKNLPTIQPKSVDGLIDKLSQLQTQVSVDGQDLFLAYDVIRAIKEYCGADMGGDET